MGNKALAVIIVLVLTLFLIPNLALADGGFFIRDKDMWRLFGENQQYCAINYKNGTQYMMLAINVKEGVQGDKAVWIFPVPSTPSEVKIDILKGFPYLSGQELKRQASSSMSQVFMAMGATQIYSWPLAFITFGIMSPSAFMAGSKSLGAEALDGINVYEHVEKMGLISELVSANSSDSFYAYLKNNNLEFPADFKSIIDDYLGKDYSFVISWVSDLTELRNAQGISKDSYPPRQVSDGIGVFVSFPTDKIFYPLKPTSVYGDQVVPAVIYVLGYVQPELYDDIKNQTEVSYYYSKVQDVPKELKELYAGYDLTDSRIKDLGYTKIKISAPSKDLKEDLWLKNEPPKQVFLYNSFVKHPILWGVFLFFTLSCISSLLAGVITFRRHKPALAKFFLFGLYNALTLPLFWVFAYLLNVERRFTDKKDSLNQEVKLSTDKKALILVPVIIIAIIILFIPLSFLLEIQTLYLQIILPIILIFIPFPLLIFFPLFFWGYYKHRKALVFNTLFSAFFLVMLGLSWFILTQLI